MRKLKVIAIGILFVMSSVIMLLGIMANNTWEVLAGFWMMMHFIDKLDKV